MSVGRRNVFLLVSDLLSPRGFASVTDSTLEKGLQSPTLRRNRFLNQYFRPEKANGTSGKLLGTFFSQQKQMKQMMIPKIVLNT